MIPVGGGQNEAQPMRRVHGQLLLEGRDFLLMNESFPEVFAYLCLQVAYLCYQKSYLLQPRDLQMKFVS